MVSVTAPSMAMDCVYTVTLLITLALPAHLPVPVRKVSVPLESTVLVSVYPVIRPPMALPVTTLALARTVLAGGVSLEMGYVPIVRLTFMDQSVIQSVAAPVPVMMGSVGMVLVQTASRDSGVLTAIIVPV